MAIPSDKPAQDIEALRKRHTDLDRKRVQAETQLKTATENLEALKAQARELYGTDDLEQLRTRLEEMKKENERKRAEYQQHLDQIESRLDQVDRDYAQARTT